MKEINLSNKDYLNPKQLESEFGFTIGMKTKCVCEKITASPTPCPLSKSAKRFCIKEWTLKRGLIGL